MLLVRQGQTGEAWRPTYQALDSKVGLLSFFMLQKLDCDAFQVYLHQVWRWFSIPLVFLTTVSSQWLG